MLVVDCCLLIVDWAVSMLEMLLESEFLPANKSPVPKTSRCMMEQEIVAACAEDRTRLYGVCENAKFPVM
jgi:hypothetical protein